MNHAYEDLIGWKSEEESNKSIRDGLLAESHP